MRTIKIKAWAVWVICAAAPIAGADLTQAPSEGRQGLPRTLVPAHYELSLIPNAQALTFKGSVQITGDAPMGVRQIVLNAKGLTFDEVRLDDQLAGTVALDEKLGRAAITFSSAFVPGRHTLSVPSQGA